MHFLKAYMERGYFIKRVYPYSNRLMKNIKLVRALPQFLVKTSLQYIYLTTLY